MLLAEEDPSVLDDPQFRDFVRESMELCFLKLLMTKAVLNWEDAIQHNVLERCLQVSQPIPI